MKRVIYVIVFISILTICSAWDQDDMEIFDLYEEINGTFYELLGINQVSMFIIFARQHLPAIYVYHTAYHYDFIPSMVAFMWH